jgi:hypothetical protein
VSSTDPQQSPAARDPLDLETVLGRNPAPTRPGNAEDAPLLPSGLDDDGNRSSDALNGETPD